ncbi:hypothetical protein [Mycobacterium neglectum]|uniref:hypothetical protein n=1 Tax=Mycobacterium neglectum TaxID=242737 RepID=UPI000BFECA01|nr:hypothetical protein [Mycobacterium neglectum]
MTQPSDYRPGTRVRVLLPNEDFTGQVGTVERDITGDDGTPVYVVRFCGERDHYPHHVAYYRADEVEQA